LDLSNITTLAIISEEDENAAIAAAEDRLAIDGIDIQSLNVAEVTVKKTGEYH
jgi:hypothetical protein